MFCCNCSTIKCRLCDHYSGCLCVFVASGDNNSLDKHACLIRYSDDYQAQSGEATSASLQAELASATSQAAKLQQSVDSLDQELSTARAEASDLSCQVAAVRQQAQQDMQAADAAFKSDLGQQERKWKAAMATAVATAVADQTARDEALRKCLRAEVEAAAKREEENLKKDSTAAMSQQAADWQAQMSQLRAEHAVALAQQAVEIESKHAQQAQHAAAEAQQGLTAHASKLQQAHTAALAKQAEQNAEQLADCKQRYILGCLLCLLFLHSTGYTSIQ